MVEQNQQKQKSRGKLRGEKGPEIIKAEQNIHLKHSRSKHLEEKGPEETKVEQNRQKQKSRVKLREKKVINAEQNRLMKNNRALKSSS
jgi:hypothetical protein